MLPKISDERAGFWLFCGLLNAICSETTSKVSGLFRLWFFTLFLLCLDSFGNNSVALSRRASSGSRHGCILAVLLTLVASPISLVLLLLPALRQVLGELTPM